LAATAYGSLIWLICR